MTLIRLLQSRPAPTGVGSLRAPASLCCLMKSFQLETRHRRMRALGSAVGEQPAVPTPGAAEFVSQLANADLWIWMIIMVIGCFQLWIMFLKTGIGRRGIILTLSFPAGGSLCLMEETKIDWWETGLCKDAWYQANARSSRLAKCTDFPGQGKGCLPVL